MGKSRLILILVTVLKCVLGSTDNFGPDLHNYLLKAYKVNQDIKESDLKPDALYFITEVDDTQAFQPMRANLSYICLAKFNCTSLLVKKGINCEDLEENQIQWFLPIEVRDFEIIHGQKSSRVEFVNKQNYYINGKNSYIIKSEMKIKGVGSIHNGTYTCSQDIMSQYFSFPIFTQGRDARGECDYSDQCKSYNCFDDQCKCQPNQVYISKNSICEPAVQWNESCSYDEQCLYKGDKGDAGCLDGQCSCHDGSTLCNLPQQRKRCMKIASLGEKCEQSGQCSVRDDQSFCSSVNRCECKTGFHIIGGKCKAYEKCDSSGLGDNDNFTRGSCKENKFCRDFVCLCLPNYKEDNNGNSDDQQWYEKYGWYIVGFLAAFLLIVLSLIAYQTRKYRKLRGPNNYTQ